MRKGLYVMVAVGLLLLGGMMSFGPEKALAVIGFTPVRDVANPALQPFQRQFILTTPADLLGDNESFTVPAGKRLVIEFVSFHINWPVGQDNTFAWVAVSNAAGNVFPMNHYFPVSLQATTTSAGGPVSVFVAGSPTRLYADPGSEIQVAVRRNVVGGEGFAVITVSGHLVNLP